MDAWGLAEEGRGAGGWGKEGEGGGTIMRVNFRPRRRLVMRKSDLVEEREKRVSLTTTARLTGSWFGVIFIVPVVGLRELLGCNVIVFDAVILQCRAYTHASAAREHIGHIRAAKCRDNCRAFPSLPSDPAASFFCFSDVISRAARQPSAVALGSHLPSRTSFPSRRPGTPRGISTNVLP